MQRKRILIVEDEAIVAEDIASQLAELGYETTARTGSGEQALTLAAQSLPDLVLMDVRLAGNLDGIAAAQRIRESFSMPVVFLTAFMEDSIIDRAKAAQPYGYLTKPFQTMELRMVIDLAITRHRAEVQMRQAHEEHTAILRTAMDGFFIVDLQSRLLEVNDAYCRMVGYSREELLLKTISELEADESPDEIAAHLQRIVQNGCARFERRHRRKDGRSIDVEFSVRYQSSSGGRLFCFVRDITQKKKIDEVQTFLAQTSSGTADEPFFNSLARYLAQCLNVEFVCIDRLEGDGLTARTVSVWCDGHFEDNVTYALKDTPCGILAGKPVCCFSDKVIQLFPNDPVLKTLRAESYAGVTLWSHTAKPIGLIAIIGRAPMEDTSLAEIVLKLVAVRAAGELERLDAEAESARLEAQLQQAQKLQSVGRLAGGVAHDFNNMLQAILSNTDLLIKDSPPGSPLREGLDEIRNCARRSADLTRQLLVFARQQAISPKVLDLNESVEVLLKMLRRLIGEDIHLDWIPAQGLWRIKIDPVQLDQVLTNLCVNARDAISGMGRVSIETSNVAFDEAFTLDNPGFLKGEYVRLSVSDDGFGMSKEIQAHIFEPFFTTKGLGKGTGLGLATLYGIVKQNNGFVQVRSEPGAGSTFDIYFPRHADAPVSCQYEIPASFPKSSGETILLVEDETSILSIARKVLEMLGYSVLAVSAPEEALRLVESSNKEIHLLITDVVMPGMNGRDLANRMQALQPKIKFLFMSGYTADIIAPHGVLDQGAHFIQKPFTTEDLALKVAAALAPQP